jgi:hypothetical protein
VATRGHNHGHQRAGSMAADGQISMSLDRRRPCKSAKANYRAPPASRGVLRGTCG